MGFGRFVLTDSFRKQQQQQEETLTVKRMCQFWTCACVRWCRFTWSSQVTPGYLPDWICSSSQGLSLSRPHCCMLLHYLPTEHGQPPENAAFSQEPMLNPTLPQETLPPEKKSPSNQRPDPRSPPVTGSGAFPVILHTYPGHNWTRQLSHSYLCFIHFSVSGSFTEGPEPGPPPSKNKQQRQEKL